MASVEWTPRARAELEEARSYIARDSPHAAAGLLERIFEAIGRLEMFPRSGRMVPEFGEETIREVIVRPYRVMYEMVNDHVRVLTVHHSARPVTDLP